MRNRFQTLQAVLGSLGSLVLVLGIILLLPLILVFSEKELRGGTRTLIAFLLPAGFSFLLGFVGKRLFPARHLTGLQAMLLCPTAWLVFSLIGALPFVIALQTSLLDSFFETMSGFTTTGITMFSGLDEMPRSILFWRALTQWVGGLGILTFFLAVSLGGGSAAHRLFGAESHKIDAGRPVPGLPHTLKILWSIYTLFSILICSGLILAGMPLFDSVCHTFTALSTGGFSPHDASIEYYRLAGYRHYAALEYILIVGMLMGGINFLIHYRWLKGEGKAFFDNTEMRYFWGLIGGFFLIIFIERLFRQTPRAEFTPGTPLFWRNTEATFRTIFFQVSAILTTTGFSTQDIAGPYFGQAAKQLFLIMMVIGGCVGSTGGGFKVLRVAIMVKTIRQQLFRVRTSRSSIAIISIDGKIIPVDELRRVSVLFFAWIGLLVIGGIITAVFSRLDGYHAFSGISSALGNIGPCYIPVREMGQLHPVIKLTYIFGMLAGRLEIIPVLLLLCPKAWRS